MYGGAFDVGIKEQITSLTENPLPVVLKIKFHIGELLTAQRKVLKRWPRHALRAVRTCDRADDRATADCLRAIISAFVPVKGDGYLHWVFYWLKGCGVDVSYTRPLAHLIRWVDAEPIIPENWFIVFFSLLLALLYDLGTSLMRTGQRNGSA